MKTFEQLNEEAYAIVGERFPLHIEQVGGKTTKITYESEWKSGTTTPVDTGEVNDNGDIIYDYKEDYKQMKLTKEQISALDKWISENVEG